MTWRRFALVFLLAVGLLQVHAQQDTATGASTEQQRLDVLRQELNRQVQADEDDCRQRFAVNDCLRTVQARHREKLSDIRRREISLHDRERQQRAKEQSLQAENRVRTRQLQLQERSAAEEQPSGTGLSEVHAAQNPSPSPVPARTPRPAVQSPSPDMREAYARKLRDAENRREARDKRVKEKATATGKQPVPLPSLP